MASPFCPTNLSPRPDDRLTMWRVAGLVVVITTIRVQESVAFLRPSSTLLPLRSPAKVREGRSMMRMSLSPLSPEDVSSISIAVLEGLPLPDDLLSQLADAASNAAQVLEGVVNGNVVAPPEQLQQVFDTVGSAFPYLTDSVKGFADSATGLIKNGVALPEGQLGDQVDAAKDQLSQFFSSNLGEAGSAILDQTGKALSDASKAVAPALKPVEPYIQQLGSQLGNVRELGLKVSKEVLKDEDIILRRAGPVISGLSKYATPRVVFNALNLVALPFWASAILAPDNRVVKAVWSSYLPIVLAASAYGWLTWLAFHDPVSLEGFSGMSDLSVLTKGFSSETSVAVAWAHLICQDLFVGRWIYLDGRRNSVWTSHSLILAFLFGPTGLVSHLVTRGIVSVFRWDVKDIMDAGASNLVASAAEQEAAQTLKDAEKALKKSESQASKALSKAKREAERTMARARERADNIIKQAETEALQTITSAKEEATRLNPPREEPSSAS